LQVVLKEKLTLPQLGHVQSSSLRLPTNKNQLKCIREPHEIPVQVFRKSENVPTMHKLITVCKITQKTKL
jgi:hypothetical protein